MTQITFTDDALVPKCITFGGTVNVVRWYAYIRSNADNNIYLQRSVNGVLDPEVLTVEANPPAFGALQPGLSYFNFIADPVDNTKAYLYFLSDGTLFRITVTSNPIGEQPTTQQFDRVNNRADTLLTTNGSLGSPIIPGTTFGRIPTPGLSLVRSPNPGQRVLVITPLYGPTEPYFPQIIEVYRAPNQSNNGLYDTLFVGTPTSTTAIQLALEVPAAVSPNEELWHVRALNPEFSTESNFAHAYDNGEDPTAEANIAQAGGSPGGGLGSLLIPSVTIVSRLPIKITRQEPDEDAQPTGSLGSMLIPSVDKQTIEPIKFIEQEPNEDAQPTGSLGCMLIPNVVKQRVV